MSTPNFVPPYHNECDCPGCMNGVQCVKKMTPLKPPEDIRSCQVCNSWVSVFDKFCGFCGAKLTDTMDRVQ